MTPRKHMAEALVAHDRAGAQFVLSRYAGDTRDVRSGYHAGVAHGHAFRALEILYDEREAALLDAREWCEVSFGFASEVLSLQEGDELQLAHAMGRAACERIAELERQLDWFNQACSRRTVERNDALDLVRERDRRIAVLETLLSKYEERLDAGQR